MSLSFHLADNQLWHTPRQSDALSTHSLYSVSPPSSPTIEDPCDLYLTFDHYPSSDTPSIDEPIAHSTHLNRDADIVILQDRDGILFPAQLFDGNVVPSHSQGEAAPPLSSISFPSSVDLQWNIIRDSSDHSSSVQWQTFVPPPESETDHIQSLLHDLHLPDTHFGEISCSTPYDHYVFDPHNDCIVEQEILSSNDGSDDEYTPARRVKSQIRGSRMQTQSRKHAYYGVRSLSPSPSTSSSSSTRRSCSGPRSRNAQAPLTALPPRPNPRSFKCPFCRYVQTNRRRPDFNRHVLTHLTDADPEKWICCGVPLEEAHEHGISDLTDVPMWDYAGIVMVGGCRKTFSRRDALSRHLKNPNIHCVGNPYAKYLRGNCKRGHFFSRRFDAFHIFPMY